MTEMNGKTTMEAKAAFERTLDSYDINVKYYHADDGLFDTDISRQSVSNTR